MLPMVCCQSDIASSDAIFKRSFRRVIDFERSTRATILYIFTRSKFRMALAGRI